MKKLKLVVTLFATGILLISFIQMASAASTKTEKQPCQLKILTGATGGQWNTFGNAIAAVLSNKLIPTSCRLGGAVANIEKVDKDNGDIGFSMSSFLAATDRERKPSVQKKAVLMMNLYPQVLYILLRKKFADTHNIENLETLLQKDISVHFATLKRGTGSHFLFTTLLKHGYHTNFDQLRKKGWRIDFNNYEEIADKFVNEELDGFAYTAGGEVPLIQNMEKYTKLVILPISTEVIETLHREFHTNTYVIQPGAYKSVTAPITTLGDYTSLIVRRDLPTNLVYSINKLIWENREYIGQDMKDFRFLNPATVLPERVEAHPGSLKFWAELQAKQ